MVRHEVLPGKHGDHIGGERDAVKTLVNGEADAACLIASNHSLFVQKGIVREGSTHVVSRTQPYDHCNFTALAQAPGNRISRFRECLLAVSYDDPEVRPLLEMEGLRVWMPGRTSGYDILNRAVDRFGTCRDWLASIS